MIRFDSRGELDDLNVGGMRFTWSINRLGTVVHTAFQLGKSRMPGVIHNLDYATPLFLLGSIDSNQASEK